MNMICYGGKHPLSQVKGLLSNNPNRRQSVVFLAKAWEPQPETGDFLAIVADKRDNDGETPSGLLLVTDVLQEAAGIFWLSSAFSVRPLESDEIDVCEECVGSGTQTEWDGPHSRTYGCEECCGIGVVPIIESEGDDNG